MTHSVVFFCSNLNGLRQLSIPIYYLPRKVLIICLILYNIIFTVLKVLIMFMYFVVAFLLSDWLTSNFSASLQSYNILQSYTSKHNMNIRQH